MQSAAVGKLIREFAERLDSTLDAADGSVLERIAIMQARDALKRYGGLWDVPRCRRIIERFPGELEAAAGPGGFPAELMATIKAACERVARALRNV